MLDRDTTDKIAAGEVIERPAAVVKELVENSLDAEARRVRVELEKRGGVIRVIDNGRGMARTDVEVAFLRHSTSKISSSDDLFSIQTLGFRGEALSSIASVARVEMRTRPNPALGGGDDDGGVASDTGTLMVIEGGEVRRVEETGCAPGTTVTVRDLFYNTPARRKFLSPARQEMTRIVETMTSLALSNPGVGLFLTSDGNELLACPPSDGLLSTITSIFGAAFTRSLVPVEHREPDACGREDTRPGKGRDKARFQEDDAGIGASVRGASVRGASVKSASVKSASVTGYISKPELSRARTTTQFFSVNGRRVWNRELSATLREAYGPLLMKGRYPVCFLDIRLPTALVDVNVHPAKREVRFRTGSGVVELLREAVRGALRCANIIPPLEGAEAFDPSATGPRERAATRILRDHTFDVVSPPPGAGTETERAATAGEGVANDSAAVQLRVDSVKYPGGPAGSTGALEGEDEDAGSGEGEDHIRAGAGMAHGAEAAPAGRAGAGMDNGFPMTAEDHRRLVMDGRTTLPYMKAVGQVHDTYIIAEASGGLFIIDQHAAHERVNLDRLRAQLRQGPVPSQTLLTPIVLELSPARVRILDEMRPVLEGLGFSMEPFGAGSVKVGSVPALLRGALEEERLADLLDELSSGKRTERESLQEALMHSIACRGSIMAGDTLDLRGMASLIRQMYLAEEPLTCAHGRPTLLFMESRQLEKNFRRIV